MADEASSKGKLRAPPPGGNKPTQKKRRGRPPIAIAPPELYPIITLSVAQEISPGESDDIAALAKAAGPAVTSDENVQAQAARDLSILLQDYSINSRLRAQRVPTGALKAWAKQAERAAREFIHTLGGDASETLPFDPSRNDAANALARALPKIDQPNLRRQLRNLQVRTGVPVVTDPPRVSDYTALVTTVHHAGNGAAAILLLAKQLQQSKGAAISQRRLRLELFYRLIPVFEQLHPGKRFTVSNQESKPSGPSYRWVCTLMRLAAGRFGTAFPELAELYQWAQRHPSGVGILIREARQYGKNVPN